MFLFLLILILYTFFFCQIKTPIRVILKKLIVIYLYSKGEPKHNKYNTKNNNTNTPEDPMASEGLTVVLYGKRRRASRNRNNQQVGFPTGGMTLTLFCFNSDSDSDVDGRLSPLPLTLNVRKHPNKIHTYTIKKQFILAYKV